MRCPKLLFIAQFIQSSKESKIDWHKSVAISAYAANDMRGYRSLLIVKLQGVMWLQMDCVMRNETCNST